MAEKVGRLREIGVKNAQMKPSGYDPCVGLPTSGPEGLASGGRYASSGPHVTGGAETAKTNRKAPFKGAK